jgi:hypothetical protein
MSTPEGKVKAKVKALLKRFNLYSHWPVLNGMGEPTLDCIVCAWGRFLAIETKAPGKQPTPRQQITMANMRAAGAFVFVVANDDDLNVLEAYLNLLQP